MAARRTALRSALAGCVERSVSAFPPAPLPPALLRGETVEEVREPRGIDPGTREQVDRGEVRLALLVPPVGEFLDLHTRVADHAAEPLEVPDEQREDGLEARGAHHLLEAVAEHRVLELVGEHARHLLRTARLREEPGEDHELAAGERERVHLGALEDRVLELVSRGRGVGAQALERRLHHRRVLLRRAGAPGGHRGEEGLPEPVLPGDRDAGDRPLHHRVEKKEEERGADDDRGDGRNEEDPPAPRHRPPLPGEPRRTRAQFRRTVRGEVREERMVGALEIDPLARTR